MGRFDEMLETVFAVQENEGKDKRTTLGEAVRLHVKPGMTVHLSGDARAAMREIIRQFWGTRPAFDIILGIMNDQALALIHTGLAKKLITSNASNMFPTPGPSAIIQKAYRERTCEIENWSLLGLTQRLMAAAFGSPFLPTRAVIGSTMETENKDTFKVVDDPFGTGVKTGLVKALQPDISVIHAWAADPFGNTIPMLSDSEGLWGARASKNPIVVTAERIVTTSFMREHSVMVKIPGYMVGAVVECPFGSHPRSMFNRGLEEFTPYGDDREMSIAFRKASDNEETLNAWIKEWVLDLKDHDEYLRKLGSDRLVYLMGKAAGDFWKLEFDAMAEKANLDAPPNATETMVCGASRKMQEIVLKNSYHIILTGIGTGGLAAWMTHFNLRQKGHQAELVVGTGQFGSTPRPGSAGGGGTSNLATSKWLGDTVDIYGVVVGGAKTACLGVLGAGQIDRFGNINSTKLSETEYLSGSGGGNDISNGASEIIVIMPQSRRRFLEKVYYISMPGTRIKTIVTNLGIYEKVGGSQEFMLTAYFPNPKFPSKDELIKEIKANCSWDLKVAPDVKEVPLPTRDELHMLRMLDLRRDFLGSRD